MKSRYFSTLILFLFSPIVSIGFTVGDRVECKENDIEIRQTPGGEILGQQDKGSEGTAKEGPYDYPFEGYSIWWKVDFDSGADGWVIGSFLTEVTVTTTAPKISSLLPFIMPGSTSEQVLTIIGSDFQSGATLNLEDPSGSQFGSDPSKLIVIDSSHISYQINNNNDVGTWRVQVINPDEQASDWISFTVASHATAPEPIISALVPSTLPGSLGKQDLTIIGSDFQGGAIVILEDPIGTQVSSDPSSVSVIDSSRITCQINNNNHAGAWRVIVLNPDGQVSNWGSFMVTFTPPAPVISGLVPSPMPPSPSEQILTIIGSDFQIGATLNLEDPSGAQSSSDPAKLVVVTSSLLTYQINNNNHVGTWRVQVINPDEQVSNWTSFTVASTIPYSSPLISALVPSDMPGSSSEQDLTIIGSDFQSEAILILEDPSGTQLISDPSKVIVVDSSRITYQINNNNDAGTWSVKVTNPDGQSSSWASFTVTYISPAPIIHSQVPTTMPGSTGEQALTIIGSDFQSGATLILEDPSGAQSSSDPAKLVVVTSSLLTFQINNSNHAGTWRVQVINPDEQVSNWSSFTVTPSATGPAPVIHSLLPMTMPGSTSEQILTIIGHNFQSDANLNLENPSGIQSFSDPAKLVVVTSSLLTYQINNNNHAGTWRVQVINPDEQVSNWSSFTVTPSAISPAPIISSLVPSTMPASTSEQDLKIVGSDFQSGASLVLEDPSGAQSSIDPAKITVVDGTQITYKINNNNHIGIWLVIVLNPDGQTSDWASFTVTMGDFIYHPDHGWWYYLGDPSSILYFYDIHLDLWGWTSEDAYPWVYWFHPIDTWMYRRPVIDP